MKNTGWRYVWGPALETEQKNLSELFSSFVLALDFPFPEMISALEV